MTGSREQARRRGHWAAVFSLVLLGLGSGAGAACSAADSVSDVDLSCKPQLCVAPDKPDGPPDGAKLCPAGVCNYQTQEGSCAANETCAAQVDDKTGTVVPTCIAVGTRKRGETCDTQAKLLCARGLQCVGPKDAPHYCRKLCCAEPNKPYGDWTACDPGESCIRQLQAQIEQPPGSKTFVTIDANVDFCVPVNNCDVLDANSCAEDKARPVCRIADPIGNVACQPKGSATLGEPCQRLDQCGPVEKCAQTIAATGQVENSLACRRLCRIESCGSQACQRDEGVCVHFERDPAGVGECTPGFKQDKYCHEVDGAAPPPIPMPAHDAGSRDASASG